MPKVPNIDLTKTSSQIAFVEGMLECLHKEAGLNAAALIGFCEAMIEFSPMEKNAGVFGDAWNGMKTQAMGLVDKAHGAAIGATAGWQHPQVAQMAAKGDIGGLLGQGWDYVKSHAGQGWDYLKNNVFTPQNLKTVAPYIVSGVGSFLGAKAMGAGTGAAALTGLAGGAAGGYGYNNFPQIMSKLPQGMQDGINGVLKPVQQFADQGIAAARKSMDTAGQGAADIQHSIHPAT